MIERLVPIVPKPGIFRNGTKYQAAGRWYDSNLIRWLEGILRPIGGAAEVQWSQSGQNIEDTTYYDEIPAEDLVIANDTFDGTIGTEWPDHAMNVGGFWLPSEVDGTSQLSEAQMNHMLLTGDGGLEEDTSLSLGSGGVPKHVVVTQEVTYEVGQEMWLEATKPVTTAGETWMGFGLLSKSETFERLEVHFNWWDTNVMALRVQGRDASNNTFDEHFFSNIAAVNGTAYRLGVTIDSATQFTIWREPAGGGSRTELYVWTLIEAIADDWLTDGLHTRWGMQLAGRQNGGSERLRIDGMYFVVPDGVPAQPGRAESVIYEDIVLTGSPRGSVSWRDDAGLAWFGVGTVSDAYKYRNGIALSLKPWRANGRTTALSWADTPFGAPLTNGSYLTGNYGRGAYGRGRYGRGTGAMTLTEADTWSMDNFGPMLVGCYTHSEEIYRDESNLFQVIPNSPDAKAIVCTPEQFIFALGAEGDGRKVMWCDQGDEEIWTPDANNQAGAYFLTTRGTLRSGMRTRRQTLLWTDVDIHAATYVGGEFIYQFEQLGDNCGIISPHAAAVIGDTAYWMSYNRFFKYDGGLTPLHCDVLDYVFGDFNKQQQAKVFAVTLTQFNEVWWFYPSASQTGLENDRYVVYNYLDDIWYFGEMERGTGVDRGTFEYALWMHSTSGKLYEQERSNAREGLPFVESGPLELEDGNALQRVQRIVPDEKNQGDVEALMYATNFPNAPEREHGPFSLTNPTSVRLTAREVRLRFQEVVAGDWRIGNMRLGILPAGKR